MICPNRSCLYLQRYGVPAEWPDGTRSCPACGVPLETERDAAGEEREYARPVVVAEFDGPHEAYLAKGRLEAEGVEAWVAGEHLANLHAMFSDTAGLIRLQVSPEDVDRALGILDRDHAAAIGDAGDGAAPPPAATTRAAPMRAGTAPAATPVCPHCGSAAVVEGAVAGGRLARLLLQALRGRRHSCITCGHRWKAAAPAG